MAAQAGYESSATYVAPETESCELMQSRLDARQYRIGIHILVPPSDQN